MSEAARALILFAVGVGALVLLGWNSFDFMLKDWSSREEYSYGPLIPFISGYLIYRSRNLLALRDRGRVLGAVVAVTGALLVVLGEISTTYAIGQHGIVIGTIGMFLAVAGFDKRSLRAYVPLLLLFFMVPLPHFVQRAISADLQLLSSELGVRMIELFGISVYLQGNVVDLGSYQLMVIEACDGLRYLFPLLTLGFLFAYLYVGSLWERALLLLSAIPITVAMNSLRIASIGVMVEHAGTEMAEGLLHDFQGWLVFMLCVGVLVAEVKLLGRVTGKGSTLVALLDLAPDNPAQPIRWEGQSRMGPAVVSLAAIGLMIGASVVLLPFGSDFEPQRSELVDFPLKLDPDWKGRRLVLDSQYLEALALDDYLVADYRRNPAQSPASLYVAYYASQQAGRAVHSPRSCLPGDGWEIQELDQLMVVDDSGRAFPVNRAVIARGGAQQVVYYWFEQRGRVLSNEFLVKWYILRDSILDGRSDGALVRIMSPVLPGQQIAEVEQGLQGLVLTVRSVLPNFVSG